MTIGTYRTVKVEKEDGIGWLYMNRPEKRNAMNPQMHFDMDAVLPEIEGDPEIGAVILTGAGEAFCAGQDLREYFRGLDGDAVGRRRAGEASERWRNRRLASFNKPTIAMVNGYCIGGGFHPDAVLRLRHRRRRGDIRPLGGQLGHPAGRAGVEEAHRHALVPARDVLRLHRSNARRETRGGDRTGQRIVPARAAEGGDRGARPRADGRRTRRCCARPSTRSARSAP